MQLTTITAFLLSATSALAAPSLIKRTYCPAIIDITAYGAADALNNISGIQVNAQWADITHNGPHPELSISQVSWSDMDQVHCVFQGVDTVHGAGPVLSNPVGGRLQVGPPQTLTQVKCWC